MSPARIPVLARRRTTTYAFALMNSTPLQSMPCYCGCVAMDHRSNLDCFFKPQDKTADGLTFEEHASFCQICVDTALLTKHRLAEGAALPRPRPARARPCTERAGPSPSPQTARPGRASGRDGGTRCDWGQAGEAVDAACWG